jgi:lysophospholipase L1-like esterase
MAGMFRPLLLLLLASSAFAQLSDDFNPPRSNCCLPGSAQTLANQLLDWNQLGRYHADNVALRAQPVPAGRVVFMGDSITDGWKLTEQFPGKPYVNRGIGGQTTQQMLTRMFQDVIDLKPAAMIVLAGTNDIARNTGPTTLEMIEENIQAMTELAKAHGIKVVLCSLTPISDYVPNRKQSVSRPPADILKLNAWIKDYAKKSGAIFADYYAATVDTKGMLKEGFSNDGLHPNEKGYALMAPIASAAIAEALR